MKKLFFIVSVFILSSLTANAQLDLEKSNDQFVKGAKTIAARTSGLDLNFGDDVTQFNLNLKGSYFIIDRVSLGAAFGVNYSKMGDIKTHAFALEANARYYFWNCLFGGVGVEFDKYKDIDLGTYLKFEAGASYYIAENVFVEPALHYYWGVGGDTSSRFGLSMGIGVNF